MAYISGYVKKDNYPVVGAKVIVLKQFTGIKNIADMALWLRADKGVVTDSSNNVTEWRDQSGNNNHAIQIDPAHQPLFTSDTENNKKAIYFDGNYRYFVLPEYFFANVPAIDVFVAVKHTLFTDNWQVYIIGQFADTTGSVFQFRSNNTGYVVVGGTRLHTEDWTGLVANNFNSTNYLYIHEGVINYQTRDMKIYFDRELDKSSTLTNSSSGNTDEISGNNTIGARRYPDGTITNPLIGYLYEMFVFYRELTDIERQEIIDYLNLKYNRTVKENRNHYTVIDTQYTDNNGYYCFTGLEPDSQYHVLVEYEDEAGKYNCESYPFITPIT